jgi:hypothetical protein
MTNPKLLAIKANIYEMGLRFNQQPTPERINAYAQDLLDYTPEQVTYAFRQVINSGSAFFPSLAEILKHLRPPEERKEDIAPVVVAEMIQLIRAYGKYDESRMMMAASHHAKLAFKALGDTSDIRNSENFETTKAQLERLVKGVLAAKDNKSTMDRLERIGISGPKPDMQKLDFSGFLPDDKEPA